MAELNKQCEKCGEKVSYLYLRKYCKPCYNEVDAEEFKEEDMSNKRKQAGYNISQRRFEGGSDI